jgi:O-antigen/teichoic acid export membrane protein
LIYSAIPVIVLLIVSYYYFNNQYKEISPSINFIKLKYSKNLFGLGLNFFFISIGTIVLFNTNNIIITKMFGPEEVASYNVLYRYYNFAQMIFAIVITPFWSAFTDAFVLNDFDWIKRAIKKIQFLWLLLTVLIVFLFIADRFFINLWVGPQIKFTSLLSFSLALYFIVYVWQTTYTQFLNGVSKLRVQLVCLLISTSIHIPLALFLAKLIGVSGIIMSQVFLFTIMGLVYYIQYNKLISGKAKNIWNQ